MNHNNNNNNNPRLNRRTRMAKGHNNKNWINGLIGFRDLKNSKPIVLLLFVLTTLVAVVVVFIPFALIIISNFGKERTSNHQNEVVQTFIDEFKSSSSAASQQRQQRVRRRQEQVRGEEEWLILNESIEELRIRLPPSIWTLAETNSNPYIVKEIKKLLSAKDQKYALRLCGSFLYSTLLRSVQVEGIPGSSTQTSSTFVSTGDINKMWTRDSAIQMGIYYNRMKDNNNGNSENSRHNNNHIIVSPFLRNIIEGAIRRQAFNIIQDPYANAYNKKWMNPTNLKLRDRVTGRGGYVATRNYEIDSGAYFLTQLYDYYMALVFNYNTTAIDAATTDNDTPFNSDFYNYYYDHTVYKPHELLEQGLIYDAIMSTINTWIIEQKHNEKSKYRYFELPNEGLGSNVSSYTGMVWSGFRPSDDPCIYHYNIPSNMFVAASLERIIQLNKYIWKSKSLNSKAKQLLHDIEYGIQKYGIQRIRVPVVRKQKQQPNNHRDMKEAIEIEEKEILIYVYEVDGLGNFLMEYDDANLPSLLSIPLFGWSKYDKNIYKNTRKRILSPITNEYYFEGDELKGIGSPHTGYNYVWPLGMTVEALTTMYSIGNDEYDTDDEYVIVNSTNAKAVFNENLSTNKSYYYYYYNRQEKEEKEDMVSKIAESYAFQIQQVLKSASCNDVMHESVDATNGCGSNIIGNSYRNDNDVNRPAYTRDWFEWANTMFVVFIENGLGMRCDDIGARLITEQMINNLDITTTQVAQKESKMNARKLFPPLPTTATAKKIDTDNNTDLNNDNYHYLESSAKLLYGEYVSLYSNPYKNNKYIGSFYQGIEAMVKHDGQ